MNPSRGCARYQDNRFFTAGWSMRTAADAMMVKRNSSVAACARYTLSARRQKASRIASTPSR